MPRLSWILIGALVAVAVAWFAMHRTADGPPTALERGSESSRTHPPDEAVLLDGSPSRIVDRVAVVADNSELKPASVTAVEEILDGTTATGSESRSSKVELSGLLMIPEEWPEHRPAVRACLLGKRLDFRDLIRCDLEPNPDHEGGYVTYSWSLPLQELGSYELWSEDPPHVIALFVRSSITGIRLVVPPPTLLSVRVIDAETQSDLVVDSVSWLSKRLDGTRGLRGRWATRDDSTKLYNILCLPGEVDVVCDSLGQNYAPQRITVSAKSQPIALTFSLVKVATIQVRLEDAGSLEHLGEGSAVRILESLDLREIGGDGRAAETAQFSSTGIVSRQVTHPGRYSVQFKEPYPGYLLPDAQIVNLKAGETTDVVIRLVRKP